MNAESVFALNVGWQAEIGDFEVVARVEQDVFGLQIPVDNTRTIMQVLDGAEQLLKIVPRK